MTADDPTAADDLPEILRGPGLTPAPKAPFPDMGQQYGHTAPNAGSLPRGRTKVLRRTTATSPKAPSRPLGACAPCHRRWVRSLPVSGPSAPRGCAPSRRARCGCVRSGGRRSTAHATGARLRTAAPPGRHTAAPPHRRAGASVVGPRENPLTGPARGPRQPRTLPAPGPARGLRRSAPTASPLIYADGGRSHGARPAPRTGVACTGPYRRAAVSARLQAAGAGAGTGAQASACPRGPSPAPLKDESRVPSWAPGSA